METKQHSTWSPGKENTASAGQKVRACWGPPSIAGTVCGRLWGQCSAVYWGQGPGYLVPFVAPPSAHPVGPHGREEGQVIAIGLHQEHGLPWVQGEAGAGVPLLRDSGAPDGAEEVTGWELTLPRMLPMGRAPSCRPWLRGLYEFLIAAVTDCHKASGLEQHKLIILQC